MFFLHYVAFGGRGRVGIRHSPFTNVDDSRLCDARVITAVIQL